MAKQKSGLGRGLNALFDESPLQTPVRNEQKQEEKKPEPIKTSNESLNTVNQKATTSNGLHHSESVVQADIQQREKTRQTISSAPNTPSSREDASPVVCAEDSKKTAIASDIYISEDALEHAKVVSRESRPKSASQLNTGRREPSAAVANLQHKVASVYQNHNQRSPMPSSSVMTRQPLHSEGSGTHSTVSQQVAAAVNDPNIAVKKAVDGQSSKPKDDKGMTGVVPLEKVQPNPDQPRTNFKPEEIEELANSIKKEGLLQPILVRKDGDHYQIIAGERRWQACKSLKMKEIPVRFWAADNDKALELALIENIQRTDLNPIEEAYGYKRLMERRGMTQSEVAQTVSKGRSTIANALRLLDLPEEAQQLLFEEKITAGHARAILSIPDAEGRKTLTNKLMNEKLSVRETEAIARLLSGRAQAKEEGKTKRVPMPASFKKAARGLTRFLSVPVKVRSVQGKNKIEIQFKDEEDLERILNLIAENSVENKETEPEA